MTSTRIVFAVFVIAVALSTALRHEPAAKVLDRIEPVEAFCENYYRWRETQAGGLATVDLICFNAQQMRP